MVLVKYSISLVKYMKENGKIMHTTEKGLFHYQMEYYYMKGNG
jgi:hypothetical protein